MFDPMTFSQEQIREAEELNLEISINESKIKKYEALEKLMNDENFKYFLFSTAQMKQKREVSRLISREYTPGQVYIGTSVKQFTEIVSDPKESKFPDAIIVASGDIRNIRYKMGGDEWWILISVILIEDLK